MLHLMEEYTVSSLNGNGLYLGSNNTATLNTDSGYTIKGTVDISNGTNEAIAVYNQLWTYQYRKWW